MPGKPHSQRNDIFLAVGERILGARQGALQQSPIKEEMRFSGDRDDGPVDFDDCLNGQP
jgi:hypothetical protein